MITAIAIIIIGVKILNEYGRIKRSYEFQDSLRENHIQEMCSFINDSYMKGLEAYEEEVLPAVQKIICRIM